MADGAVKREMLQPFFDYDEDGCYPRCVKGQPLEAPRWPVACRDFPVPLLAGPGAEKA
ncbi:hypothetical protein [Streptomyces sp. Ag82_G6-1]|uniref:hypothetical protein n=1 Tax=Streptomyces sp. Ag82_G6-1 TaxID=1938853 RepID=UPI0015CF4C2F|nr:hypothetical protein [Streptomyces sp. Ag82_G6-1]